MTVGVFYRVVLHYIFVRDTRQHDWDDIHSVQTLAGNKLAIRNKTDHKSAAALRGSVQLILLPKKIVSGSHEFG